MNLNRAQIIGNLTRDPESRTTPNGQTVCSFSIATSYAYKDATGQKVEKPEYHNIVVWGKLGEICAQYLAKGRKAYVEGRLQTRDWTSQDGQKRSRTEIIAENVIILDRPGAGSSTGPRPAMNNGGAAEEPIAVPITNPDDEIKIEDIPF
ncbi:MAG: single-stranded DNA-binding protein [Candidatus Magasanikbacteria bacterium]|nr:single-stranded DNA-binding protein [Candidatus Magasanikbacteria bacterium]